MNTIVFDFGGVLFRTSATEMYRERFVASGRTSGEADRFLKDIFTKAARSQANKGRMSDVTDGLAKQYPEWADDIMAFNADRDFIKNVRGTVPGMSDLLQDAKSAGFRIYGLTNWAADTFETLASAHPDIISVFDTIVVSGRLGIKKPDGRIFQFAQAAFSRPDPDKTIFVDDKDANVREAENAVGWVGYTFENAQKLRQRLGL